MAAADVVWITGATSGIGRAVAMRYLRDGRTVACTGRNAFELAAMAEEAAALAGRLVPVPLDVTRRDAVRAAVERIETDIGPIGLALLNAGTHEPVEPSRFDAGAFRRLLEVNVMGTVHCIEALLPRCRDRGRGELAIVASVAGYRGLRSASAYGASKAALINMAEALRFDLRRSGIKVRLINPGFVRTPLTDRNRFPMPFLVEVEPAAERIVQGLAGSSFEIAFPRRFIAILKLLRMLPYAFYFPLVGWATRA